MTLASVSPAASAAIPTAAPSAKSTLSLEPLSGAEFRAILARHMGEGGIAAPAGGVAAGAAPGGGLGERVMARGSELSSSLHKDQQFISRSLEQASRSGEPMQLMKAMVALNDYQLRVQFVAKASAKATGAVDSLTKLQ